MPKRKDLKSIMVIGAGPIIIGQACEFDYSGTQACKALKDEGYKVILVNSNPATIMTDPDLADVTYIEPIEKDSLEKIIKIEKPNAILPTMGGQTALNKSIELYKDGILKKFNIELIGANPQSILKAENRLTFRDSMGKVGIMSPKSEIANNSKQALKIVENLGYPVIIRPSFTLGGTGGGIAKNKKQFLEIVRRGLDLSPVKEILIEESLIGWKEYEMEVIRDKKDNCIIICSIENVDPMGIHTGDSITVAPALTLTDKEYQIMRDASILCLREVGVETGGSNVQFAINPKNGDLRIIEMNPRVSRSSALASKATGFPIAKVATKLAVGYTLDELKNEITKVTPASFEPTIDYVVTKIPRFDFEKFSSSEPLLTTSMKSVGEVMAIGRTFQESLQKALRSTEIGLNGLNDINDDLYKKSSPKNLILKDLKKFHFDRILKIAQALRNKISIKEIYSATKIDLWFLEQIKEIIDVENDIKKRGIPKNANKLNQIKSMGFSDLRLAELANVNQRKIRALRQKMKVTPVYKRVDTCSAEFESFTPYMYSTYKKDLNNFSECESKPLNRRKVIILGGGPNRIGQGIEFDYCCCHASYALRELGYETIMINCNPETVSTDYDTSDRLYFEPLAVEDILEITKVEQKKGNLKGVIIQFGGQTPLKISRELESLKIPILGTSVKTIDLTEDRKKFKKFLKTINLTQPKNGIAYSKEEAEIIAKKIQYPVVIRPSYVLGGRAMEIAYNQKEIKGFFSSAAKISGDDPILVDKFLDEAIEVDVDALCDGKEVYIAGIMEHIEKAGIHSGDSACTLPPHTLNKKTIEEIRRQTNILAKKLNVKGLINIQYAIKNNVIYILEVNPRASRTIPFVSKATGTPVVKIATKLMMGKKLKSFKLKERKLSYTAVKEAVFSFEKFPGSDILLGPEMKSTGEVMGIDKEFSQAFAKSQIASNNHLPLQGTAFISVKEKDKFISLDLARQLINLNFNILATRGTQAFFNKNGLKSNHVNKVYEGSPHIVNFMQEKKIDLVINTTQGRQAITDSFSLRRAALTNDIPYFTTIVAAQNAILSIKSLLKEELQVKPLQHYY